MTRNNNDIPVSISKDRARGGVTGHHVRYVLAFGLAGVIIAFIALAVYFGLGEKPNDAPDSPTVPPRSQDAR